MTLKEASENGVLPKADQLSGVPVGVSPALVKMAGVWPIPKTAEKPVDGRTNKERCRKA